MDRSGNGFLPSQLKSWRYWRGRRHRPLRHHRRQLFHYCHQKLLKNGCKPKNTKKKHTHKFTRHQTKQNIYPNTSKNYFRIFRRKQFLPPKGWLRTINDNIASSSSNIASTCSVIPKLWYKRERLIWNQQFF